MNQTTKQPTPGEWLREEHPEACHASAEESTPAMDHDNRSPRTTKCQWCGMIHTTQCPRVKAFEYHPDGTLKRIEFFTPNDYPPLVWGTMQLRDLKIGSTTNANS